MSYETTPDTWIIVEISNEGQKLHKVLAGWRGGWIGQETWQLNSGIVKIYDKTDHWEIIGYSGSVYHCYKDSCGFSGITKNIFNRMFEKSKLLDVSVHEVNVENILELYKD